MNKAKRLDWFSPAILFPVVYIGYIALGLIPFSNLWYPPLSVLLYFGLGLASYLLGVLVVYRLFENPPSMFFYTDKHAVNVSRPEVIGLGKLSPDQTSPAQVTDALHTNEERLQRLLLWVAWAIIALGMLASLVILVNGIPILNPGERSSTSAAVKVVTNGLWFGMGLVIFLMGERRKIPAWLWVLTIVSFLVLFLIAYRTPLIYLGFMILMWWHYQRRSITLLQLCLFGFAVVLGGTLFGYTREVLTYGVDRWNSYVTGLGISPVWAWLVPFHILTREGVSVFQQLVYVIPHTGGYFGTFHFSSILSALPGEQESPRRMVTYLLGNRPEVTTTPSIIGPFYIDFGVAGIAVGMFLLGTVLAAVYLNMGQHHGLKERLLTFFYAFLLGITLAGVHTGILDIGLYLLMGFCYLLWRFVNIAEQCTTHDRKWANPSPGNPSPGTPPQT